MTIQSARVVLSCDDLDETLRYFTERLGFRVDAISPADDPRTAVISGHGARIELQRDGARDTGRVRLVCRDAERFAGGAAELEAPNGTRIEIVDAEPELVLPPIESALVIIRMGDDASWNVGRAGLEYRDLIPGRLGGSVIASHIRIQKGGPVPDYVHFHKIRFQMIYCYKGWVRVVYEGQGPPFVMNAGDCVLQPPEIRHRVLECSDGFEVVEIGYPAEHDTFADHEMALPTQGSTPERTWDGQAFVCHVAANARWQPGPFEGYQSRDLGLADATRGIASARITRASESEPKAQTCQHDGDFLFYFVLEGSVSLDGERLAVGDAFVLPRGTTHTLAADAPGLELLEVAMPAR